MAATAELRDKSWKAYEKGNYKEAADLLEQALEVYPERAGQMAKYDKEGLKKKIKSYRSMASNSFQNGRTKALQAITNRAESVGVKLVNEISTWYPDENGDYDVRYDDKESLVDILKNKGQGWSARTIKQAKDRLKSRFGYTEQMISKI